MSPTMSRKERQAHTRQCLMASAGRVFARRGLEQASIDEVAEDAGFTKGAFYANFASKEELFLAMLDERFAERVREQQRLLETDDPPLEQARAAGDAFTEFLAGDREWQRLFFEFSAYAVRNEEFRQELVTRYRTLRAGMAENYRRRGERLGMVSDKPYDRLALMVVGICNGLAMERLLEPDAVDDDLLGETMEIFFTGLLARSAAESVAGISED